MNFFTVALTVEYRFFYSCNGIKEVSIYDSGRKCGSSILTMFYLFFLYTIMYVFHITICVVAVFSRI